MTAPFPDSSPLSERLRHETGPAHRRLEASMGFDLHQPDRAVARAMLRGFFAVLHRLEPALGGLLPETLMAGRAKLGLLRRDLLALGCDPDAIAAPAAMWLPRDAEAALGALYVLEGSTLGGKLIVKALRRLPDWPIGGISYFDPYGADTGPRWQAFRRHLDGIDASGGDAVVAGAMQTFVLLERALVAEVRA